MSSIPSANTINVCDAPTRRSSGFALTPRKSIQKTFRIVFLIGAHMSITALNPALAEPTNRGVRNVVLVHGAWADGSSWAKVIPLLLAKDLRVVAVQNPLSSLPDDVAATKRALDTLDGPTILVGHSYGGVVISEAGNHPKVAGLVFVAAFAPDTGQAATELGKEFATPPGNAEVIPDKTGFLRLSMKGIEEDFAQDLPLEERMILAATQGPTAGAALGGHVTNAAWRNKPSWYAVAKNDRMISPALEQSMATKISARAIVSLQSSHVAMLSHPQEIADLIIEAAATAQGSR